MRILLPPSEGKTAPSSGAPLDLAGLGLPSLTPVRRQVAEALVGLCQRDPVQATEVLGLGPTQSGEVIADAQLLQSPCAAAIEVYSGVLFDALDWPSLDSSARQWAASSVLISSALFGLLRTTDPIPYYRLSGSVRLPGLPTMKRIWSATVGEALDAEPGLVVDMRSGTYTALGRAPGGRSVAVRVMTLRNGNRVPVSHHNKAAKGQLVRAMADAPRPVASAEELVMWWIDLGWDAELGGPGVVEVMTRHGSA